MRNKFLLVVMMLFMAMGSAISAQSKTGGEIHSLCSVL